MHKHLFIILLFLLTPFVNISGAQNNNIVKLIANNIVQENNIITAMGNVLLFSPNYYITAQKLIYDKNNSTMEAFDNVSIVETNKQKNITNYVFLDMKNEIDKFTPILLIDEKEKIWINAKKYNRLNDTKYLEDGTLSSCDCNNPEWSLSFGSADYNTSKQWINTYNNTLYFGSIPAWYLLLPFVPSMSTESLILSALVVKSPYFGFSTNNTRRTGLLKPKIAHDDIEGWSYMQPIYYAPYKNYDFEYIPQIREKRGYGHELRFRYADSPYSMFYLSSGRFYEKDSYFDKQNLINNEHYGTALNYSRSKLLSNKNNTDGLYIDLKTANDVEYLKTQYEYNSGATINRLQLSQVKYFHNSQDYHFNLGISKYDDISKENDDDIIQIEPYSQIFKYSKNLLFPNLFYNIDIKQSRYTRKLGVGADRLDISIPLQYQRYFINDYLLFAIKKDFSFQAINYNNDENYKNGTLIKSNDSIFAETDLIKSHNSFIHSLSFKAQYNHINYYESKGDLYGFNTNDSKLSSFSYSKESDNLDFIFNQNFYNLNKNKKVSHNLKQKIILNNDNSSDLDNLENSLVFYFPYTSLSNKLEYNHEDKKIVNSSYQLRFAKNNNFLNYDYAQSLDNEDIKQRSSILDVGTKFYRNYTLKFKDNYDLDRGVSTLREMSLNIDKKCWAVNIKLSDALVATATTTHNTIRQNTIYITYTLKPLGTFDQKIVQDAKEE
jgi:LPS-assembly protein